MNYLHYRIDDECRQRINAVIAEVLFDHNLQIIKRLDTFDLQQLLNHVSSLFDQDLAIHSYKIANDIIEFIRAELFERSIL